MPVALPHPAQSSRRGSGVLACLTALVLGAAGAVFAAPAAPPRRSIRVVMDRAYAPYSFQSDAGRLQGIFVDRWRLWERETGVKVEIVALDWAEAVDRMCAGEFDVIAGIVATPKRRQCMDFGPPFVAGDMRIFFRNEISGLTDLASLRGFPFGVKEGDQHNRLFQENGVTTMIPFPSHTAIVEAARQRKINVFAFDRPSALYLLNKAGLAGEFRQSDTIFHDEIRRGVRKGDAATLALVEDGFAALPAAELRRIDERWFGQPIHYRPYFLYAGYAVAVALIVIAGLFTWNRALRERVDERTAALGESEQRFRQTAETLRVSEQQLHALVEQLHHVREEEAKRIARELHDDLGQRLTALNMELANLEGNLPGATPAQRAQIDRMRSVVDRTIETVQSISSGLRLGQLDTLGLTAAIEWHLDEFSRHSGIACRVASLDEITGLSDAQSTAVFRILQETLTNVARHAGATEVEVALRGARDRVTLWLRDNGRGITAAEWSDRTAIGLLGMRERAQSVGGELTVSGEPGAGTTVLVTIPVARPAPVPA